jgi:hypothetical protein
VHVQEPPAGWTWGYYFIQTPENRLGFFLDEPYGIFSHAFNDDGHPWDNGPQCYWGFDNGVFLQPYEFDPMWFEETFKSGSFVSKYFGP